jgi:elongation factor 4
MRRRGFTSAAVVAAAASLRLARPISIAVSSGARSPSRPYSSAHSASSAVAASSTPAAVAMAGRLRDAVEREALAASEAGQAVEVLADVLGGEAIDRRRFPIERIRNISIVAHVDHGKSTLSSRILERTGTLAVEAAEADLSESRSPYLDKLPVERARGITVKAQTVSVVFRYRGAEWLINLVDTPGHVDFSTEVRRSLMACQGAVLLVDAGEGVQAQTLANFYLAFDANLAIVPVVNKIDLPNAAPEERRAELCRQFGFHESEVLFASGKAGVGVDAILRAVVDTVPHPPGSDAAPLRALMFDSWFDSYRGVVCLVAVVDGVLRAGMRVRSFHNAKDYKIEAVGVLHPERVIVDELGAGQVGFIVAGMKNTREALVGDTFVDPSNPAEPLAGFRPSQPMVFASLYCLDGTTPDELRLALDKLVLTDSSVAYVPEHSEALGYGYRCGFLGLLHMEVVLQRLEQEFGAGVIASSPTVPYRAEMADGSVVKVESPATFPSMRADVRRFLEPYVNARIYTPRSMLYDFLQLCRDRRGTHLGTTEISEDRVAMDFQLPLSEIISDFVDFVKTLSSGYASVEYTEGPYIESDLVKVQVLLNGVAADSLSTITCRSQAVQLGRSLVSRLRNLLRRQQFEVAIQASVDGKVVARETLVARSPSPSSTPPLPPSACPGIFAHRGFCAG